MLGWRGPMLANRPLQLTAIKRHGVIYASTGLEQIIGTPTRGISARLDRCKT